MEKRCRRLYSPQLCVYINYFNMIELGWSKIHKEMLGWLNGLSIQGNEFGQGMKTNIKGKKSH